MKYFYYILICLFPNFFWGVLSFIINTNRSLINIDYFATILLYMAGYRKISILVFVLLSYFDFINVFSQIFPFIRFADLFYLIKFTLLASPVNFIIPITFIIFVYIYFYIFNKINFLLSKTYILVIFNFFILFFFLQNQTKDDLNKRPWRNDTTKIVYSQILNTYELRSDGFLDGFKIGGDAFNKIKISASTKDFFETENQSHKILVVVNESWGSTINNDINHDVVSDIIASKNVENYKLSKIKVDGFTINGELRELCQKSLNHFNLKEQKKGFENCLPNLYRKIGYSTYAMHAATGAMYDRKYWYPRAGFQNLIFRETIHNLKSRCYSFPGFCDRDLIDYVAQAFKKPKVFFYWLTLNTHVNYDLRDLKLDKFDCLKYKINKDSASCRNLKLQKQFFYYLSELIKKPEMKGVDIIVVGDHAPPVYAEDKKFFEDKYVGTLRIKVK